MLFGSNSMSFNTNFAFLRDENDNLSENQKKWPINVKFSMIDHIY